MTTKIKKNQIFNPYKASVTLSANQSLNSGANRIIALNSKLFDTNNNFDTSTYKYTAPVTGYYQVNFCVGMETQNGATDLWAIFAGILKNGAATSVASASFHYVYPNGNARFSLGACAGSRLIYLVAGDYLQLYGASDGANVYAKTVETYLDVHLVSA